MTDAQGYKEFEFDLPEALLERLVGSFADMTSAPLDVTTVSSIPEAQGVYQLFLRNALVYVGKTDADRGLQQRLRRHAATIQHRQNLDVSDVTFKAIRVFVFTAMDLESQLIEHYSLSGWQRSGFGSNDPGRNREDSRLKRGGFDETYPIDIDRPLDFTVLAQGTASEILSSLKLQLPYNFRFEMAAPRSRQSHSDLDSVQISLPEGLNCVRDLMSEIVSQLPDGWQATDMYSRVILYKEVRGYTHGTIIARSP